MKVKLKPGVDTLKSYAPFIGNHCNWNTNRIMSRNAHTKTGIELVTVQKVVKNPFRKPFRCHTMMPPMFIPKTKVMDSANTAMNKVQGSA